MLTTTQTLRGWGRYFKVSSQLLHPESAAEAQQALASASKLAVRAGGRSYGDAALNAEGALLLLDRLPQVAPEFDAKTGRIRCSAALTQREVLQLVCPAGWVLPAIPGSREITLGGKIAADAHGKNHYAAGSTIKHVLAMEILLADGSIVECSREKWPDLFWTTAGGLGLTGVVLSVEMQLRPIASTTIVSEMHGFEGVDQLIDVMESHKDTQEYLLGWSDGRFKPGAPLSGAVAVGKHVPAAELSEPWALPDLSKFYLPFPNFLPGAGWQAARVLNFAIAGKFKAGRRETKNVNQFFFPQDAIVNWNVAFGFKGFVEYHCCLPLANARAGLVEIHDFLCRERMLCSLVAIKRFGEGVVDAPLSFPLAGYSLALDLPVRANVIDKLNVLDQILLSHSGRVNPVKDSRLSAATLRQMYPRLDDWLKIKRHIDPNGKFSSNMSRRLELGV